MPLAGLDLVDLPVEGNFCVRRFLLRDRPEYLSILA